MNNATAHCIGNIIGTPDRIEFVPHPCKKSPGGNDGMSHRLARVVQKFRSLLWLSVRAA
jgi:hypothetical protein